MTTGTMMKKRYPFLAALATLGALGLGQLYNGKLRRAIAAYALCLATVALCTFAPLSSSLSWLCIVSALSILLGLVVAIDAYRDAHRIREIALLPYNRWYIYLAVILVHGLLIGQLQENVVLSSIRAYKIPTQAMSPTLEIGDRLVADMNAYKKNTPARGDVIIFKYPKNESVLYIKRVIGLPGEKLEMIGRTVYVNGKALAEGPVQYIDPDSIHGHYGPYDIPQGQYFVMGDNRDNSQDSRFWGFVKQHQLLGQARYLYWAKDKSRIGKQVK
jgi:signal peptidase I